LLETTIGLAVFEKEPIEDPGGELTVIRAIELEAIPDTRDEVDKGGLGEEDRTEV